MRNSDRLRVFQKDDPATGSLEICVWCGVRDRIAVFWTVQIGKLCNSCFTLYINSTPEEQDRITRYRELETTLELE
jgi:hypothetical protein